MAAEPVAGRLDVDVDNQDGQPTDEVVHGEAAGHWSGTQLASGALPRRQDRVDGYVTASSSRPARAIIALVPSWRTSS